MSKDRIKLFTVFALLLILTSASLFVGCTLCAEDCYVFGAEEFQALYSEDNTLSEGAFRIMSANVLVSFKSWGGEDVKPRAHRFAQAIKHYSPDVIGMQEMCGDWYKYLLPQIKDEYEVVEPRNSLFMENRTAILYNKTRLNLLESSLTKYSKGDKNGCRVLTAGLFERKSDGKKLAVTSTHLDLIRMKDYDKEKSVMLSQIDEFFAAIDRLNDKYEGCPIFMTGDYNSMERESSRFDGEEYSKSADLTYYKCYGKLCASFAYEKIVERFEDSKFAQGVERYYSNSRGYLYDDPTWDHIFMTNTAGVRAVAFRVLASDYFHNLDDGSSRISDHLPICLDVSIS